MATYTQFRRVADKGTVKRLTWVCGIQHVLVEEVINHVRTSLGGEYFLYFGGQTPEQEIWDQASQYPLDPDQPKLIIVRNAEAIKNWEPFISWTESMKLLPKTHLLFQANDPDFPYTYSDGKKEALKPHVAIIRDKGTVVRCHTPNDTDLVEWVTKQGNISEPVAKYLLARSGGDLGRVRSLLTKTNVFDAPVTEAVVDLLLDEDPGGFVTHLLTMDKPKAFNAAGAVGDKDVYRMLGLIDSNLETLSKLYWHLQRKKTLKEIVQTTKISTYQAMTLWGVVKLYDPHRRSHCQNVLATIDSLWRQGARVGILESLVTLW